MSEVESTALELAMARDAVRERDRRQKLVDDAERVRHDAEAQERQVRHEAAELVEAVEDLEGVTGTRIWASLRGDRDERLAELDARQAEVAAALAAAESEVAAAAADSRRAFVSVRNLGDPDERLAEAVRAREAWLLDSDTPEGRELTLVVARLESAQAARESTADLRSDAQHARSLLTQALGELDEAHDRARKDVWSDSSRHDRLKYEALETADDLIGDANAAIARLRDRLEAEGLAGADRIETGGSSRTWDTWFDNWWTDSRVRDEIDGTSAQVSSTRGRVDDLVGVLEQRLATVDDELRTLRARRIELLG
ncbi:hypothetical protein [Nocardioides sp.]|uniref:hypothetical protein n=1 Tax=Nocardioides sp. TaxID=35761 RepID=UPI00272639B6|nr:hypothetical protein [Nocardioides sp.]MDO9455926.1 hypothetical protein [Nocardioides sp.]